jgi:dienelactone hydrolase
MLKPMALTKLMLVGRRAPLNRTPRSVGLDYEDALFKASDGVTIRGWFIPSGAEGRSPAVVFVHGWLWNRLGNVAGQVPVPDKSVDFLPSAKALHDAGLHVLLVDLRNHGESAGKLPITFGVREAWDFQGALQYLRARPDVDPERLGALGCSMGANAVLYGTPDSQPVKAVLAVQPTKVAHFNSNYARAELGPVGPALLAPMDLIYKAWRAPLTRNHDPSIPAARLGETVVQYVQGTGDPWGVMADVVEMSAKTPRSLGVIEYESAGRYEGYRYVNEAVEDVAAFFKANI